MADRFDQWCRTATSYVRYVSDRAGIAKGLRDHLEDHWDALLEYGYDQGLAESHALEAMGNPREVGWELNRAHSPLWSLSKLCLGVTGLLCVFSLFINHSFFHRDQGLLLRFQNQNILDYDSSISAVTEIPDGRGRADTDQF